MKIIQIWHCNQCPHFKAKPLQLEDSFMAICTHCDLPNGDEEWTNKIGRDVSIPRFCPLIDPNDDLPF